MRPSILSFYEVLTQWFPNFSSVETTWNILVLHEAQNIDLSRDWRTTWATNLADFLESLYVATFEVRKEKLLEVDFVILEIPSFAHFCFSGL